MLAGYEEAHITQRNLAKEEIRCIIWCHELEAMCVRAAEV